MKSSKLHSRKWKKIDIEGDTPTDWVKIYTSYM